MDGSALPLWIYLAVSVMFVGGALQKALASHLSSVAAAAPPVAAWLGAAVLWALCLPGVLPLTLCLACVAFAVRKRKTPDVLSACGKAVLITGCDSGFGNATAKHLDSLGFEVFATVLDLSGDGARMLQRTCSSRLTLLQVDITQPQQVQQALLDTKAKLGLQGLWGLVNNAGVCVNFGDAELSLMSNYRSCMEVNFFGTLSVTKSFLPLLRHAKGRIVTVSSPAGDQPFPCLAAYGASKAALNLFINTLRHELEPWGVRVSTILPSSYKTGQASNHAYWERQHHQLLQSLPPALLEDYGEDYVTETKELFQNHTSKANTDLSPVVDAITQALLSPRPQPRYFAGPGVGLMYFIHSYCPFSLSNRFLQNLFVKKKLMPRALRAEPGFDLNASLNNNNNEEKL
ncbi:11-beta-hydroxysteroid dehydrogenase type 2 [Antennarius striatus]|uniref:11-beta-hydroxysteroid dehydrogenase type 2 n=1 Tax=Antennarius striatus TaxID=241820 RepID=UPI0035B3026F